MYHPTLIQLPVDSRAVLLTEGTQLHILHEGICYEFDPEGQESTLSVNLNKKRWWSTGAGFSMGEFIYFS